jgi:hypothetical protein
MRIAFSKSEIQQVTLSQYNPIAPGVLPADFASKLCIFRGQFEDVPNSRVAVTKCCPLEDCLKFEVLYSIFCVNWLNYDCPKCDRFWEKWLVDKKIAIAQKLVRRTRDIVKINSTHYSEKNLYLTEDLISQSFFYIGWNCL